MKNIFLCTKSCLVTLGVFALLIPAGTILARTFGFEGLNQAIAPFILNLFENKILILLMINLFLIILGMFIDNIPILILVSPLLIPIAESINMNLIHLGVVIIINAGIGMITPPYADAIFVGSRLADIPFEKVLKPVLSFLFLVALPVLLLTTFVPALSCWLPTLVLGPKVVGAW